MSLTVRCESFLGIRGWGGLEFCLVSLGGSGLHAKKSQTGMSSPAESRTTLKPKPFIPRAEHFNPRSPRDPNPPKLLRLLAMPPRFWRKRLRSMKGGILGLSGCMEIGLRVAIGFVRSLEMKSVTIDHDVLGSSRK